jgi:RNA polymerase sigma factor (sigma-70 family)
MPLEPRQILIETYLEKRDTLLRVFSASLRDQTLAEDVLQDLYLRISMIELAQAVDNPLAYLFRAANNIALNRLRASKSKVVRDQAWQDTHVHTVGTEVVDDGASAEAQLIAKQTLANFMRDLSGLPELSQTIIRLNKFDGMSQIEVAKHLGISISTVEKRLSAALKFLVERYRAQGRT